MVAFPESVLVDDLNTANDWLNGVLDEHPLFDLVTLAPGEERVIPLPDDIQSGEYVILRYEPEDEGSCAAVVTYVEFDVREEEPTAVREGSWGGIKRTFRR